MSSLGDVLELVFAGPDPTVTVRAVIHERQDESVAERAEDQMARELKGRQGRMPAMAKVLAAPALALAVGREVSDRVRRAPRPAHRSPESQLEVWQASTRRARIVRTAAPPAPGARRATRP